MCQGDTLIQPDYQAAVANPTSAHISALEQDDTDLKNDIVNDIDRLAPQFQQVLQQLSAIQPTLSTNAEAENAYTTFFNQIMSICTTNGYSPS